MIKHQRFNFTRYYLGNQMKNYTASWHGTSNNFFLCSCGTSRGDSNSVFPLHNADDDGGPVSDKLSASDMLEKRPPHPLLQAPHCSPCPYSSSICCSLIMNHCSPRSPAPSLCHLEPDPVLSSSYLSQPYHSIFTTLCSVCQASPSILSYPLHYCPELQRRRIRTSCRNP